MTRRLSFGLWERRIVDDGRVLRRRWMRKIYQTVETPGRSEPVLLGASADGLTFGIHEVEPTTTGSWRWQEATSSDAGEVG